jgi:hypothetical protein
MDIPLISHYCSLLSRLAYFNNSNFLNCYTEIINIPELKKQLLKIKDISNQNIFQPKINNINSINNKINEITNEKYKHLHTLDSSHIKYICISSSNYSSVYIIADKLLNTIFITFRGTYSIKSAQSYLKLSTIIPYKPCKKSNNGILIGIFKIVGEIFYTICESIDFLSSSFLESTHYKLVTTGHSLGGACSQIFSYLLIKNKLYDKVSCVTFGSPRVMNKSLIDKFNSYIKKNTIMFQRYITYGDPIVILPFTTNSGNSSYYHPDDENDKLKNVAINCKIIKKTKKITCNFHNKTNKTNKTNDYDFLNHSIYLGISYKGSGEDITKEIEREDGSTICRIITGGNNEDYKVVFFLLDDLKYDNLFKKRETSNYFFNIENLKIVLNKKFTTDYKHQDVYMNTTIFNKLLKNSVVLNKNNLHPTEYDKLASIEHTTKKPQLYCV